MSSISPKLASQIALLPYELLNTKSIFVPRYVNKSFSFDGKGQSFTGKTGGMLSIFGKKTTGFALIGEGKDAYKSDIVLAVRGTDTLGDIIADANVGLKGSPNGHAAHAGFVNLFNTIKPQIRQYLAKRKTLPSRVHCVGHSLGGAIASLFADWLKAEYSLKVNLYTFGTPRIGMLGYASKKIDKTYRCTHGADPVPMFPLWPFVHAGEEYRLDASVGVVPSTHKLASTGNPGYVNTAKSESWTTLRKVSKNFFNKRVVLDYNRRKEAAFNQTWKDKIIGAVITLLRDSGIGLGLQSAMLPMLTIYDILARHLSKIAAKSKTFAAQTKGLLGHILVFSGRAAIEVTEISYKFVKWVFALMTKRLYNAVRTAFNSM
ncbi:lipase family protein [Vibrio nigripulchritudo]|uniref:lipase family protein n=1 Tax=Vibrio nigripulchritudo TaxID=28173 RepID=UPI0005FA585A|nr:lipase family protein [Vibrio nigripulchritudo]KJY78358.1 lipase [Vibrio nigripulchritudo]